MKKELTNRFFTSLILIGLLILMLNYSFILISFLLLVFVFSWIEFINLIEKIYQNKKFKTLKKNILKFLFFMYLLFFLKIIIDDFMLNYPNISWNLVFVITICILTDIGGYLFGKTFKGKKLTRVSPNKTYSGMIGSFFLTLLFTTTYSYTINFVDFKIIFFISILISAISQIGDLLFSYLKRKSKVKDTGNILPGHGGILDRIDGILFALPLGLVLIDYFY
jgi:phosphatidate cytidylyltransferase